MISSEETIINNEYDYSNIIPTIENITRIIKYCDQLYNSFLKLIEDDEQKNQKLKYEFQNYNYKKTYSEGLEINIRQKSYNSITCKNYSSFIEAINSDQLINLDSLEIELNLDYKRGNNDKLSHHQNLFKITFKPYEIKFVRKSNYKESEMNQVENNLNEILKSFPVANTIFCTKQ